MVWIVNPEYVPNSSLYLPLEKKMRCLKGKKCKGHMPWHSWAAKEITFKSTNVHVFSFGFFRETM